MQIKQLALVAHFLLASSFLARDTSASERGDVCECLSRECSLVAPSGETWTREFGSSPALVCVRECSLAHVRIIYQFRSPVGSLNAKVTGEYWPSDLSFSRLRLCAQERLAKLDSTEIISQVCTKTINNSALLASRARLFVNGRSYLLSNHAFL